MADDPLKTSLITDLEKQTDIKNDTCPPNANDSTALLQFEDIGKEEYEFMIVTPEDAVATSNVIILGSVVPDSMQQGDDQEPKSQKPNEVEALSVPEVKEENDVLIDGANQIYRKYKLRNVKKPDYRIPSVNDLPIPELTKAIKQETLTCPEDECDKIFDSTTKLHVHMRRDHNIIYKCCLCSQVFETNEELVSHKSVHESENRSFVCHSCKLAFSDHCDFLVHETTHSKDKFKCQECGLITMFKSSIQKHIHTHFNRTVTCPICSEEVQGEHRLPAHIRQHTSKFECVECGKVNTNLSHHNEHMAGHTGVKIHQCLYCGKGFATKNQKEVHTRIHTNEKPFSCKVCDRKFIQCADLKRHEARHDNLRKIQCDICNKKFIQRYDLQLHMKTHAKGYCCPECGKNFSLKQSLKNHLLHVHSSERPVECKLCGKSFASHHHYRKHTKSKMHTRYLFKVDKRN